MAQDRWAQMGEIVARAWADPAYKARLLSDATAVLREEGIEYPPGIEVKIVENTETVRYITLPLPPSESALSEEDLGRVAGGAKTAAGNSCRIPDS